MIRIILFMVTVYSAVGRCVTFDVNPKNLGEGEISPSGERFVQLLYTMDANFNNGYCYQACSWLFAIAEKKGNNYYLKYKPFLAVSLIDVITAEKIFLDWQKLGVPVSVNTKYNIPMDNLTDTLYYGFFVAPVVPEGQLPIGTHLIDPNETPPIAINTKRIDNCTILPVGGQLDIGEIGINESKSNAITVLKNSEYCNNIQMTLQTPNPSSKIPGLTLSFSINGQKLSDGVPINISKPTGEVRADITVTTNEQIIGGTYTIPRVIILSTD